MWHRPEQRYEDMLVFGETPTEAMDDVDLLRMKRRAVGLGATAGLLQTERHMASTHHHCITPTAWYRHVAPDSPAEHTRWHRELASAVDMVLDDFDVVDDCFGVLMNQLEKFAAAAPTGTSSRKVCSCRCAPREVCLTDPCVVCTSPPRVTWHTSSLASCFSE